MGTELVGQHIHNILCRGFTGKLNGNRERVYSFVCPYCDEIFESRSARILPKTGRGLGVNHCGCQTYKRRATRVGIPPTNKLSDRNRTISQIIQSYKGSAKHKELEFTLTSSETEDLVFNNCYYCGVPPCRVKTLGQGDWTRPSLPTNGIDRKDPSMGYVKENVVSCCSDCNYFKSNITFDKFCLLVNKISENLKIRIGENNGN